MLHPRYTPHSETHRSPCASATCPTVRPTIPLSPLRALRVGWGEHHPGGPTGPPGGAALHPEPKRHAAVAPRHRPRALQLPPRPPELYSREPNHCPGVTGPGPPVGPGLGAAGVLHGATQTQRGAGGRAARSRARLPDGRPGRDDDPAAQSARGGAGPEPAGEFVLLLGRSGSTACPMDAETCPASASAAPRDGDPGPAVEEFAPGLFISTSMALGLSSSRSTPVRVYGRGGREHPGHHRRGPTGASVSEVGPAAGGDRDLTELGSAPWDPGGGLHWDPEVIFAGQRCLVYAQLRGQPQDALSRREKLSCRCSTVCTGAPRHSHGGHHPAVPHPGPDLEGDAAVLPAATGWRQRLPVHRLAAKSLLLELEGAVGAGSEGDGRRALEASLSSGVVCSLTTYVGVDMERGQLVRWDVPLAERAPEESPLLRLVSLQNADVSWNLDPWLAAVLGVSETDAGGGYSVRSRLELVSHFPAEQCCVGKCNSVVKAERWNQAADGGSLPRAACCESLPIHQLLNSLPQEEMLQNLTVHLDG
ncbi:unnamed protein product [Lepidochelys kempii]